MDKKAMAAIEAARAPKAPEAAQNAGQGADLGQNQKSDGTPADTKAGESQAQAKAKGKEAPSTGQSIAQVAGADKPGASGELGKDDPKGSVIVSLTQENRELKKMIRDEVIPTIKSLQEEVRKGRTSAGDVKDELDAIAEKWELEPAFVKELASVLTSKSKKQFEDEYLSDFKDIKAKTDAQAKQVTQAQISAAIAKEFDRVAGQNPDLAKIANKDAVKKYILANEDNLKRTMEDLLEELYGNAAQASAGMEGYRSKGQQYAAEPNLKEPTRDDHKRIAELREKTGEVPEDYTEGLLDRLSQRSHHRK